MIDSRDNVKVIKETRELCVRVYGFLKSFVAVTCNGDGDLFNVVFLSYVFHDDYNVEYA